jgi:23S rRNA (adenine2030-N6)-methyltransferase
MNYRHAFHAGNFADVHKHAVLARIIVHLSDKPAAFRIIDTHAGAGRYDLDGELASRTNEWREGIGRLLSATSAPKVQALLAPYLGAVALARAGGRRIYPGSPALACALMRRQDRLIACEREPGAAAALARLLARERRAKAIEIDGWTGVSAYIPPRERRGLVLIDPPFEDSEEFARLPERLAAAHRKWPTGIVLLWYPLKTRREADTVAAALKAAGIAKILRSELTIAPPKADGPLSGSGLIVINPPWRLDEELAVLGPALAALLGRGGEGRARLDWIVKSA